MDGADRLYYIYVTADGLAKQGVRPLAEMTLY